MAELVKYPKIREAAEQLGVSYGTIRNAIEWGRLTAYRIEGAFRIAPVDLSAYLARCETRRPAPVVKAPTPAATSLKYLDGARSRAAWHAQGVLVPPSGRDNAPSSGSRRGPSAAPKS